MIAEEIAALDEETNIDQRNRVFDLQTLLKKLFKTEQVETNGDYDENTKQLVLFLLERGARLPRSTSPTDLYAAYEAAKAVTGDFKKESIKGIPQYAELTKLFIKYVNFYRYFDQLFGK